MSKKIKKSRKENFEDKVNNMQLDKEDNQQNNLTSKCRYLSETLVLKYPHSFICSYCVQYM